MLTVLKFMGKQTWFQSRMLYTQPAFRFVSYLNNTPKPDSVQKPGFVIFRDCLLVRQPLCVGFGVPFSGEALAPRRGAEYILIKSYFYAKCTKIIPPGGL